MGLEGNSDRTLKSITATAITALSWLGENPVLCDITSITNVSFSDFRKKQHILFIQSPVNDAKFYAPMVSLIFQSFYRFAFSKLPSEDDLDILMILDEFSSENARIIIAGNNNPKYLYYAHRKGWLGNKMNLMDAKLIDRLKSLKCELIIWNKGSGIVQLSYPLVFEDENFEIYQITDKNK